MASKTVLIVFAHEEHKSFNGALLEVAKTTLEKQGHKVLVSDLYAMKFDALTTKKDIADYKDDGQFFKYQVETGKAVKRNTLSEDIKEELRKLEEADLVILQFPLYWFSYPAAIKGWMDRVFVFGYVYGGDFGMYDSARYKGKKAMLSFTTGANEEMLSSRGRNGDVELYLWQMQNNFRFCNFDVLEPQISYAVAHIGHEARVKLLEQYAERIENIFQEKALTFLHNDLFTEPGRCISEKELSKQPFVLGQHGGKFPKGNQLKAK